MERLHDPKSWLSFATLAALEIILGIDNIIFLSILVSRLPAKQQGRARFLGLAFAMVTRLALLFSITWIATLTAPLFEVGDHPVTGLASHIEVMVVAIVFAVLVMMLVSSMVSDFINRYPTLKVLALGFSGAMEWSNIRVGKRART